MSNHECSEQPNPHFCNLSFIQVRRKRSILMKRLNLTSVHSKDCRLHPSSDAAKKREELNGLDYREGIHERGSDEI